MKDRIIKQFQRLGMHDRGKQMKRKLRIGLIGLLLCFLGVGGGLWFRAKFVITSAFHEQSI